MFVFKSLIICAAWLTVYCQGPSGPTTTPVPILKQINRQNDDGSYSFGYEAADGSFKIETKYPNGDVAGKYGYVDESGKLREISYGASSKRGFEPEGPGIMVPPPTLNNPNTNALPDGQEDDGQYREDPSIYEDPKYNRKSQSRPAPVQYHQAAAPTPAPYRQQTKYQSAPRYTSTQDDDYFRQSPQQFPDEDYRPQSQVYHQQPQFSYQASIPQNYQNYQPQNYQQQNYQQQNYQQQNYQQPSYQQQNYQQQNYQQPSYQQQNYQQQNYQNYNPYSTHPALQNLDPNTGSYTINFTG